MKILHVNMALDPVFGGGTTERTSKLNLALNELEEVEARVLTTDAGIKDLKSLPIPLSQAVILPCWNKRWHLPAPYFLKIYHTIADWIQRSPLSQGIRIHLPPACRTRCSWSLA